MITFKRRIRRQAVGGAGSRVLDEGGGGGESGDQEAGDGGSSAPSALPCAAEGLHTQRRRQEEARREEEGGHQGSLLGAFKEVVEDEDEDQDSDVDVDNGDLPVYAGSLPTVAGAGGARKGKRKREVDWAGKHACVGVGGSLSASIKGLRSLGRMGSGSAATGAALMPRSVCQSSAPGAASVASVEEGGGAKPKGGSGLARLLDDLNRVSQDTAPEPAP